MPRTESLFSEYAERLEAAGLVVKTAVIRDVVIKGITYDSREVRSGMLFVCKGAHFKPEYLRDAISRGAVAYVSQTEFEISGTHSKFGCDELNAKPGSGESDDGVSPGNSEEEPAKRAAAVPHVIVSDIREAMPVLAECYYGRLYEKLKMIGITGTKGKSTTTYFVRHILDDYLTDTMGKRSAFCSGIDNYDGLTLEESHLTTPEIIDLYQHMSNVVDAGIPYLEMEVSSQALRYGRVSGIHYELVCFLNIGTDHISDIEHADFEDYFTSKLKFFDQAKRACINMDSDCYDRIEQVASKCEQVVRFSETDETANVLSCNVKSDSGRVRFDVRIRDIEGYEDTDGHIELAAFGVLNVKNAIAAIAIAATLGVPFRYIQSGLSKAVTPGRMEVYYSRDGRHIGIVDYAHNQMSYEALLSTIKREFPDRRIVMVFGSTGGKAQNRRRELGTTAGRYCSHVVLTEDDGGMEDVASICREIASYLGPECSYEIIEDRPSAIRKAVADADENTIVIAAGKAREHYQKRGDHYVEIESDVDVMREVIAKK